VAFSPLALFAALYVLVQTYPKTKPAVMEIGKGRGSGEAGRQRAGAALSTTEGRREVGLVGFSRLPRGSQRVPSPRPYRQQLAGDLESQAI